MLKDDFLKLIEKIDDYKCVCIFVDNSGFDITLGILPLVIEFLKNKQTKVNIVLASIKYSL